MNIYLVERPSEEVDYDEYYGFVVVARDPQHAKQLADRKNPRGFMPQMPKPGSKAHVWIPALSKNTTWSAWAKVRVTLLGTTSRKRGMVILGSNRGG